MNKILLLLIVCVTFSSSLLGQAVPSAYYKFNEGSGTALKDSSGNGIAASIVGTTLGGLSNPGYTGSGFFSNAFSWNGTWFASVPNSSGQVLGTTNNAPFSIALWVNQKNIQSGNSESVLVTNEVAGASGFRLTVEQLGSGPQFKFKLYTTSAGGTLAVESPFYNVLPEGWTHVAATFDGTNAILYVNGVQVGTAAGSVVGNSQTLRVGAGITGLKTISGFIDELRFYKVAITLSDLEQILHDPKSTFSAYYKFNEGSGTALKDSSGNGIAASIVGTTLGGLSNPGYTGSGFFSNAFSWNGTWFASVPNSSGQVLGTTNNAPFSIALWVNQKHIQSGDFESVLVTNEVAGTSGFRLTAEQLGSGPQFKFKLYSTSGGGTLAVESPFYNVLPEGWTHVAATFDGTNAILYVNGVQVGTAAGSVVGNSQTLRVGAGVTGLKTISGFVDELRFYKASLDAQAISDIFNQPKIVVQPFDHVVIRYKWVTGSGTDLDTRTAILTPTGTFSSRDLGYGRYGDSGGSGGARINKPSAPSVYYMQWAGDNTLTQGPEAVLLNVKQLAIDYPAAPAIEFRLRAYWWSTRITGNFSIEFQTWLGGTMSQSGYDFINTGGVAKDNFEITNRVLVQKNSIIDGEDAGTLLYYPATRTFELY